MSSLRVFKLFNLIVSHNPGRHEARRALRELNAILGRVRVFDTPQSLLLLKVDDPFRAVELLARNLSRDTAILRVIPLDAVTTPYVEDVADVVEHLAARKMPSGASYAIRMEGHLYHKGEGKRLHKVEAIKVIAERISNRVNLREPDYLVLIKVVRACRSTYYAGVMVAPPRFVLSTVKMHCGAQ